MCEYLKGNTCQIDKEYCTILYGNACRKRVTYNSSKPHPEHAEGSSLGELLSISAELLKSRLSDFPEDYPKTMPKKVIYEIEKHNEHLRVLAVKLSTIARRTQ